MKFTHHLKGLKKTPYTLRAYAKGLEYILEPIINKMCFIENRIKNCGKFLFLFLVLPYEKCMFT